LACDINANCFGGNTIAPKPGYYRSSVTSPDILSCYNPISCLGGDEANQQGTCSAGYNGFMCGSCDINWVKNNWESCTECPSYNTSLIFFGIRLILFSILVLGVSSLQASSSESNQNAAFIALIKLVINHCVLVSAVSEIKYHWSEIVKTVMDIQTLIVVNLSKFTQFNCLINGTTDLVTPREDDFYNSLLLTILSPILFIVWFSILFFLQRCVKGANEQSNN